MRYVVIAVAWVAAMLMLAALGQYLDRRHWRRIDRQEREQLRSAARREEHAVLPWRHRDGVKHGG